MKQFKAERSENETVTIGNLTFSTKDLKEGTYNVTTIAGDDGELFAINMVHEEVNMDVDERFIGSEPFAGPFSKMPVKNIVEVEGFTFPEDKMVLPFILNDGQDNIGLNFNAAEKTKKG